MGNFMVNNDGSYVVKKAKVEIVFQEMEDKFLDLSGVPVELKVRSRIGKYLYKRECFNNFIKDIVRSLSKNKRCKTMAILGTAGIGKSALFLLLVKLLLEDPSKLGVKTRSFYFQTRPDLINFYFHDYGNHFSYRKVQRDEILDATIIHFADMETSEGSPNEHIGVSLIFTSFRPDRFRELTKNGSCKVLPTWSLEEQEIFFNSRQFKEEYGDETSKRAYDKMFFFGGCIRSNIDSASNETSPTAKIEAAILRKGDLVCERFFKVGFGGTEDIISDILIHRNPQKKNGEYNFDAEPYDYSFASPYVFRLLRVLNNKILVTEARNKYKAGTYGGGDDGSEFELLCLHGFKFSGVEFLAKPLTDGAVETVVSFPEQKILERNWRDQMDYLEADFTYIPPYGNLESGDAFCLINVNQKWKLVIVQITIAENHPVKQNGIKVILDCYTKNSNLQVEEIVIMFMIPKNGTLNSKQQLVTQKNLVIQQPTIVVNAQYKIENSLLDFDVI